MPSPLRQAFDNLAERIDEDLIPMLVRRASLPTASLREELDAGGVWRVGGPGPTPTARELDDSAQRLIRQSGRRALVRGALAGAAGVFAIPPELAAAVVQTLHLGQRLALVYGHDPERDAGRVVLIRAMAEAFELELPDQTPARPRVRELPALLVDSPREGLLGGSSSLVSTLAVRAAVSVASRFSRAIPGVGAGVSALAARRSLTEHGHRMHATFRRTYAGDHFAAVDAGAVEDAIELTS
jgi:hypothetical protein